MNLVRFLLIGAFGVVVLGEFAKYPFGAVGSSLSLLDILVGISVTIFLIWKIGIRKQIDFPKLFIFLFAFCLTGLLSLLINQNFSGGLYLIRLTMYSILFWIGFSLSRENFLAQIEKIIIGSGVLLALTGFLQLLFFPNLSFLTDFGYDPHILRLTGTFLDPNFLGAYLCFAYGLTLITYFKNRQKKYLFLLILFFVAIILTFSRSAWVMFGILNLFVIWKLPKKIVTSLVVLSLIAVLFVPRVQERLMGAFKVDISASERFSSWQKGIELFDKNPIVGIGFNNVRSVSIENNLVKPFTADGGNSGAGVDSSWLLILATTGVIGFGLFSWFYFQLVVVFLKDAASKKRTEFLVVAGMLIAFLVESQFINSLFYPPLMLVLFLITGGYYAAIKEAK